MASAVAAPAEEPLKVGADEWQEATFITNTLMATVDQDFDRGRAKSEISNLTGYMLNKGGGSTEDLIHSLNRAVPDWWTYRNFGCAPMIPIETTATWAAVSVESVMSELKLYGHFDPQLSVDAINFWRQQDENRRVDDWAFARTMAQQELAYFLAHRIAGIQFWHKTRDENKITGLPPGDADALKTPMASLNGEGMFRVKVTCHTPGYRIFVSPAYFVDWMYFGAPSSPVENSLLPGQYIFGTDAHEGRKIVADEAVFRIPSDFNPQLAKF